MLTKPDSADDDSGRAVFDCLSAVVLLLTALLGAYLPKFLSSRGGQQSGTATSLAFHLGNMLSGGVMLSAGFCHLLADSLRQLAFIGRFPIATFLAAVGYLITLLADQLAQVLTADKPSSGHNPDSNSLSNGHRYIQVEKDDSAIAVEMMETQHKAFSRTTYGAANGLVRHNTPSNSENGDWGSVAEGDREGLLPKKPLSAVQIAAGAAGDLSSVSDNHVINSATVGDTALCVAATGRCSGTVLNGISGQHSQQQGLLQAAAWLRQGNSTSQQPEHTAANGDRQQQQHDGYSDIALLSPRLPCSQHLVTSPTYQQNHHHHQHLECQQACQQHHRPSNHISSLYPATSNGVGAGGSHQVASSCQDYGSIESGGSACRQQLRVCCSGQAVGSSTHPEDMTEACTVARAAGHLELELQSPGTGQAGNHGHAHFQVFLSHQPLSFATTVLLACALCIHSILEGIALGAQQSMKSTQDIMLAIAAHKGLAAYALGASIVESKASNTKFWAVVSMFAIATPLGIGIGYAFSNIGHGSMSAAMSALASGTFLYVALNEVIPKELEHPDGHRLLKVAALLTGFGLMSLLAVWA